tara:strand:- start:132 stop:311 length:180 start_codon:yes stop_codon:yes gene_type:complete
MVYKTENYKVELQNDLLMIKDSKSGNLLKAMTVPAWNAIERFKAMVEKVKEVESKSKSK